LQKIVNRWGEVAQIGQLSPHDFRRTFTTLSLKRGAPPRILSEAGRWANEDMIATYTPSITQDDFRAYFPIPKIVGLE